MPTTWSSCNYNELSEDYGKVVVDAGDVIFKMVKVLVRLLVRIRVDGGDNAVGHNTEFPDVTSPDTAPSLLRAACSWEFQHDDTFTFHLPPSTFQHNDTSGPMPMDLSARRPNKVLAEYIQTFRIFRTKKIHFLTSKFMPKQLEKMSVWRKWTKWLRKERNVIFLLAVEQILHFAFYQKFGNILHIMKVHCWPHAAQL